MWDVWTSYWSWSRFVCSIVLLGIQCQYFWMFVHPWFMIHQSNRNQAISHHFWNVFESSTFEFGLTFWGSCRLRSNSTWDPHSPGQIGPSSFAAKCTPNGVRHHVTMFHVHPWSSRFMWTCTSGHLMNYNADIADLCVSQLQEFKSSSIDMIDMPRWVATPRLHIDVTWGTSGFVECKSSGGLHFKMCYFLPNCTRLYNNACNIMQHLQDNQKTARPEYDHMLPRGKAAVGV